MMKRLFVGALAALAAAASMAATTIPVQLVSPSGSTAGQTIVSTGPSSAPAWGNVTAAALAAQAANTVVANVTGSSASPTAFPMPSCSAANSALQYASSTGWVCGTAYALTTGTLAQFAATTSAQLAGVISDETGSGALVFGTSPTITTPTISGGTVNNATVGITTPLAGKFTTLQATSTITPSSTAGIVGTATNDDANAGSVGEYVCAQVWNGGSPAGCATNSSTPVSLTSGTTANVTSISLSAGDWEISGVVGIIAAGGTTVPNAFAGSSTTSATLDSFGTYWQFAPGGTAGAGPNYTFAIPTRRIKLASTTTVYLVANASFTASTCTAIGRINARRPR